MELSELQERVNKWINTYGVKYFSPLSNTCILTEEVGELAKIVVRKYGEQSFKEHITEAEIRVKIEDELADILWVITCLANQMEIDLERAMENNFSKKNSRDKERHLNNKKLLG